MRDSLSSPGDYVLSVLKEVIDSTFGRYFGHFHLVLCCFFFFPFSSHYQDQVFHYQIIHSKNDAFFSIDKGKLIHGLDALIEYYQKNSDGLNTPLTNMIKGEPPPNHSRINGRENLLHRAIKSGDFKVVSEMLKCGYRIDAKNEHGKTVVHLACQLVNSNDERILKLLIESKANVDCRDKDGNTPLHVSVKMIMQNIDRIWFVIHFHLSLFVHSMQAVISPLP